MVANTFNSAKSAFGFPNSAELSHVESPGTVVQVIWHCLFNAIGGTIFTIFLAGTLVIVSLEVQHVTFICGFFTESISDTSQKVNIFGGKARTGKQVNV